MQPQSRYLRVAPHLCFRGGGDAPRLLTGSEDLLWHLHMWLQGTSQKWQGPLQQHERSITPGAQEKVECPCSPMRPMQR